MKFNQVEFNAKQLKGLLYAMFRWQFNACVLHLFQTNTNYPRVWSVVLVYIAHFISPAKNNRKIYFDSKQINPKYIFFGI